MGGGEGPLIKALFVPGEAKPNGLTCYLGRVREWLCRGESLGRGCSGGKLWCLKHSLRLTTKPPPPTTPFFPSTRKSDSQNTIYLRKQDLSTRTMVKHCKYISLQTTSRTNNEQFLKQHPGRRQWLGGAPGDTFTRERVC